LGINQVVVVPLGHYGRPTAWDRILQDEPLDVVPDKFVPAVVSTPSEVTITVLGNFGSNVSTVLSIEDALFRGNYMVMGRQTGMSFSMGTRVEYELCQTCVDGNQPLEGMPERPPWPRNRRERHILAALSRERIVEIAKKVDKDVGVYGQISDTRWNVAFWEAATPRERTVDDARRPGARRPR
jgi:hypothetical protein